MYRLSTSPALRAPCGREDATGGLAQNVRCRCASRLDPSKTYTPRKKAQANSSRKSLARSNSVHIHCVACTRREHFWCNETRHRWALQLAKRAAGARHTVWSSQKLHPCSQLRRAVMASVEKMSFLVPGGVDDAPMHSSAVRPVSSKI
jgi:hypothetical protein